MPSVLQATAGTAPAKPREARHITTTVELREAQGGGMPTVVGYAAVFNQVADSGWGFREQVATGAFSETLARGDDVAALVEHETCLIVARTGGTLKLTQDDKGLRYEFVPADTTAGRDLVANLRAGNIKGSSFGFYTDEEKWDYNPADGGDPIRTLVRVSLFDISPVVFPFYEGTEAGLRSFYGDRMNAPTAPTPPTKDHDETLRRRVSMMQT